MMSSWYFVKPLANLYCGELLVFCEAIGKFYIKLTSTRKMISIIRTAVNVLYFFVFVVMDLMADFWPDPNNPDRQIYVPRERPKIWFKRGANPPLDTPICGFSNENCQTKSSSNGKTLVG